jgi:hypothetical protein
MVTVGIGDSTRATVGDGEAVNIAEVEGSFTTILWVE